MTRCVFDLDEALVGRIARFTLDKSMGSQVASVRALLQAGLDLHETRDQLLYRYRETGNSSIFNGHPLVRSLHQEDGNLVKVVLRDGTALSPEGGAA